MGLTVVVYVSCCIFSIFVTLECVVFELEDYDLNRVILVEERDIVMTCSAPEVSRPQYEITHEGVIVNSNTSFFMVTLSSSSVEVTITQVQNTHGGEYECAVTGGGMTIVSKLTLDVRDPNTEGGVYCPQSSETLAAHEGDSLSLFCYFLWSADSGMFTSRDFVWQRINGSSLVTLDDTMVTRRNFFKGLAEVVTGPLNAEDSGTEYRCHHRRPLISGTSPCSVGPVIVIPRTIDVSTTPTSSASAPETSTMVLSRSADIPSTTNHASSTAVSMSSQMGSSNESTSSITVKPGHFQTFAGTTSFSTSNSAQSHISPGSAGGNMASDAMTSDNSPIIIVILACVAVIIVITFMAILLCLIFLCRKGQKHEDYRNQESNLEPTKTNSSDPQNGYLEPKSDMEMSTVGGSYDGMVSKPGSSGRHRIVEQNLATYDKVNHNPVFSRTNGQKQSERKYDDAPVGIQDVLDPWTLYGKPHKLTQNSDREEDLSDLYRKVDKTATLNGYSKRDEEDAGLY